jgi:hypothetical protein
MTLAVAALLLLLVLAGLRRVALSSVEPFPHDEEPFSHDTGADWLREALLSLENVPELSVVDATPSARMVPVRESTVWREMLSTRGDALFVEAPSTANRSQLVVNRSHPHAEYVISFDSKARALGASGRSLRDLTRGVLTRAPESDTLEFRHAPDARSLYVFLQNVALLKLGEENPGLFAELLRVESRVRAAFLDHEERLKAEREGIALYKRRIKSELGGLQASAEAAARRRLQSADDAARAARATEQRSVHGLQETTRKLQERTRAASDLGRKALEHSMRALSMQASARLLTDSSEHSAAETQSVRATSSAALKAARQRLDDISMKTSDARVRAEGARAAWVEAETQMRIYGDEEQLGSEGIDAQSALAGERRRGLYETRRQHAALLAELRVLTSERDSTKSQVELILEAQRASERASGRLASQSSVVGQQAGVVDASRVGVDEEVGENELSIARDTADITDVATMRRRIEEMRLEAAALRAARDAEVRRRALAQADQAIQQKLNECKTAAQPPRYRYIPNTDVQAGHVISSKNLKDSRGQAKNSDICEADCTSQGDHCRGFTYHNDDHKCYFLSNVGAELRFITSNRNLYEKY